MAHGHQFSGHFECVVGSMKQLRAGAYRIADEIDRHAPPGNRALHHAAEAARLVASKWRAAVAQSPAAARQVEADDLALARRNAGLDEERRR